MLRWRLLLGALFIAAFVGLCWLDAHGAGGIPQGGWLFPLALLASVAATDEMLGLLASRLETERPLREVVHAGNLLIMLSGAIAVYRHAPEIVIEERPFVSLFHFVSTGALPIAALAIALLVALLVEFWRFEAGDRPLTRIALTVFIWVYVPLLLCSLIRLRIVWQDRPNVPMADFNAYGMLALASLIAIVKMGDTGAYTVGRLIGRRKMAPRLSPGKTWEGAVGAIVFAALTSCFVFGLGDRFHAFQRQTEIQGTMPGLFWPLGQLQWIVYGVVLGIAGIIGDLAESLIKRDCGQKDSSRWMPGFGGVLDLLDSILLAAPVAWLFWAMGWVP